MPLFTIYLISGDISLELSIIEISGQVRPIEQPCSARALTNRELV